jgi:hypothetical protein
MTILAAKLGMLSAASDVQAVASANGGGDQQTRTLTPASPKNTSFASMKQVNAGVLNVGYAEDGPADGQPVILLHAQGSCRDRISPAKLIAKTACPTWDRTV